MSVDGPTRTTQSARLGVLSRVQFVERIEEELAPFTHPDYAIGYIHISHMRHFNRVHGIAQGDEVIYQMANKLLEISAYGLVARYTINSFIFVIPSALIGIGVETIDRHLHELLVRNHSSSLQALIGTVVCHRPLSVGECIDRARFACQTLDKTTGIRTLHRTFDDDLQEVFDKRAYVVDHLDEAIARGEIRAYSQPIIRLIGSRMSEVEVLARWESERFGFLRPDEFIPELERHRLIHKLDLEVLRLACVQWSEAREAGTNVPFGINLSRLDFELCDIFEEIRALMARYDVPVGQVHIEITESALASSYSEMTRGIKRFRAAGFKVYMDDYGSGYSSIAAMAGLDFDVIKIDKSLIDQVEDDERARVVLADTVSTIKRLGMQTLCEGVETIDQMLFLRAIGCEKAQGYFFSKPVSHEEIMGTLEERSLHPETPEESEYLNVVGKINLSDGTSALTHGIEAAAFHGQVPIAVLEFCGDQVSKLTGNLSYTRLMERMGFSTLEAFVEYTKSDSGKVNARAMQAAALAKQTGKVQHFDFIVGTIFCSASIQFVAQAGQREAYLNIVTSVERSPQVTEHTLLRGLLESGAAKYFWKDTQRRFLGANRAFLDYFGFTSLEQLLGKTDEDMDWNLHDTIYRDEEIRVLAGEAIEESPGVVESRGELRSIIATKRPLVSRGAIVGLLGFFYDVGPYEGD